MLQRSPTRRKKLKAERVRDAALFIAFIKRKRRRIRFKGRVPTAVIKPENPSTRRSRESRERKKYGKFHTVLLPKKVEALLTLQMKTANPADASKPLLDEAFDAAFDQMLLDIITAAAHKK